MDDSVNPLQEVSANEVDLDAIFNSTNLDHDQLKDIVGHLKELERQPLHSQSLSLNCATSAVNNVSKILGSASVVNSFSCQSCSVQNAVVSPSLTVTSFTRSQTPHGFTSTVRPNGVVFHGSGANGGTSAATANASNARVELFDRMPLTSVSDVRTSAAFCAPMYRQVIPATCSVAPAVGSMNGLVSMSSVGALLRSHVVSMSNLPTSVATMPSTNSAGVGLRPVVNPAVQLVNVVQTQDGATRQLQLPQQRAIPVSTSGTNQSPVRFTVQPHQLQRLNMSASGIPQLLPGSVLMRNEHGQLIVVQQGHAQLNGSMIRQPTVSLAIQHTANGLINASNASAPLISKPVGMNPMLRLSSQQLQNIVNVRNGLQSMPGQVVIGRSPVSSGCLVVHTAVSSVRGVTSQPMFMNSNSSYPSVSSSNILQSLAASGNIVLRGQAAATANVVRPQTSIGNFSTMPTTIVNHSAMSNSQVPLRALPFQTGSTQAQPSQHATIPNSPLNGLQLPAQDEGKQVMKVKNFFSTLRKLAAKEAGNVIVPVTELIQKLIDSVLQPEDFTNQIEKLLKSSPQPGLANFLKMSLPLLRNALQSNKVQIEGIRPPPVISNQPSLRQIVSQPMRPVNMMQQLQMQMLLQQQQQQLSASARMNMVGKSNGVLPVSSTRLLSTGPSVTLAPLAVQASSLPPPITSLSARGEKRKFDISRDNDDINDVAAMGGVNLAEESRNIMATNSDLISGQMRSCKEETFLDRVALMGRINSIVSRSHGVSDSGFPVLDVSPDIVDLVSHAVEQRLRPLLEKLSVVTEHRVEMHRNDPRYQVTSETKAQLKFLADIEALEKKRHEDLERQTLMRAAKSRTKSEDPEQVRLKEKAKALQMAEMEQLHTKEANVTALAAIGPRKQVKAGSALVQKVSASPSGANVGSVSRAGRMKRANMRDMILIMEQDNHLKNSRLLSSAYNK